MKALLDTHVWIWYLLDDERLRVPHKDLIEDDRSEVWLSPVSVWEAHLLIERGRIPVVDPPGKWIRKALERLPVREAPLTFDIARRSRSIELGHQDPADRFIAATALEMKLKLLTADERLVGCRDLECV